MSIRGGKKGSLTETLMAIAREKEREAGDKAIERGKARDADREAAARILAQKPRKSEHDLFQQHITDLIAEGRRLGRHVTVEIKPNTQWDPVYPADVQTMSQFGVAPQRIDGRLADGRRFEGVVIDEVGPTVRGSGKSDLRPMKVRVGNQVMVSTADGWDQERRGSGTP